MVPFWDSISMDGIYPHVSQSWSVSHRTSRLTTEIGKRPKYHPWAKIIPPFLPYLHDTIEKHKHY